MENDLTISKDVSNAKLTLKVADNAKPVDDHKVTVTGFGRRDEAGGDVQGVRQEG